MQDPAGPLAPELKNWYLSTGRALRAGDKAPRTPEEAERRARETRGKVLRAERDAFPRNWGSRVRAESPLEPQLLGVLERDGYRVERLIFQTQPGVFATANVYVPARGAAPFPAVLCVHGHWQGARRDPVPQARCIGLAKLGFVVLILDAWGAGERGTTPGQNEYHGGLLGASLWPVNTPLHGLQLYENVRALDYLQSRPEVDGKRIGCTGASGGGNQTTQISAFDERIGCAVPVCSVGTFESYLNTACCVDEVLDGGLTYAEEGDLLGMVAPRALLVVTASRDAYHFGPEAARAALDRARGYFRAHDAEDRVKHAVFESGHDYSQPMREAMYGWMRRWLKGEGDGSPTPEPPIKTEDPAAIACFDPASRPAKVMTTVRWVGQRGRELADAVPRPRSADAWSGERRARLSTLRGLLALPKPTTPKWDDEKRSLLVTEPGVRIPVERTPPAGEGGRSGKTLAVLLHPSGARGAIASPLARSLHEVGIEVCAPELRGCGELTLAGQNLGDRIQDHNIVEWSLWIGRPLLGQWVHDTLQLVRALGTDRRVVVVGYREAGLAALLAAALEERIRGVATVESLASFVSDAVPHNQRMVVFQPGLLKVGDVPHLAGLVAPRRVLIADPIRMDGMSPPGEELLDLFEWPRKLYLTLGEPTRFAARAMTPDPEIAAAVRSWLLPG